MNLLQKLEIKSIKIEMPREILAISSLLDYAAGDTDHLFENHFDSEDNTVSLSEE